MRTTKAKVFIGAYALIALVLACFVLPGPSLAADRYWIGGNNGYWDSAANWSPIAGGFGGAGQPQAGDDVYLTQSSSGVDLTLSYRNTINPGDQLGNLYIYGFGSGRLTLDQSNGGQIKTLAEYIGIVGRGAYTQSSGTNSVAGEVRLGDSAGSSGAYNLTGGTLSSASQTIGFMGTGAFTQSDGANSVAGLFVLGNYGSGSGTYSLKGGSLSSNWQVVGNGGVGNFIQSGGYLTARNEIIGMYGSGTFTQTGGSSTVGNTLTLAFGNGSRGIYNLQAGGLTASTVNLKTGGTFAQTGGTLNYTTFNQQGGTVTGSLENRGAFNYTGGAFTGRLLNYGSLNLGSSFTAGNGLLHNSATPLGIAAGQNLTLNGWGLTNERTMTLAGTLNATSEIIGGIGTAAFTQTGGSNTVSGALTLARQSGSHGVYNLQGGAVTSENLIVGGRGAGSFTQTGASTQTGGNMTVTNAVNIGMDPAGTGSYTMDKGTLTTRDLTVGGTGTGPVNGNLDVTSDLAQIFVSGNFTINPQGKFTAAPGVTVNMTGCNFYNFSRDPSQVDMRHLRMFFSNGHGDDTFMVAGTFFLDTLELASGGKLTLDGQPHYQGAAPEALYVSNLIMGDNSTLDFGALHDIHLYFLHESLGTGVTFLNGLPQSAVPLPGTVWLLLTGLVGLGVWRKKNSFSRSR